MAPTTAFSLRYLRELVKWAEEEKAEDIHIELGINRRVYITDTDGNFICNLEGSEW